LLSISQAQGSVDPQLFSCSISAKDQATKTIDYAMNTKGLRKFAILAPANKAGEELAQTFWDEIESRQGEVKAFELYDPDLTDFREPVDKTVGLFYSETRAKEANALAEQRKELNIKKKTMKTIQYFTIPPIVDFDAVIIADEAKTVGQIIPTFAYRDAKNLPYFGISSWNSNQLIQRAGDQAEGAAFPVAFNTLNPPDETKRFYDIYSKTYSAFPGELDAVAFDAAALMIETLAERPSSRAEFTSKLEIRANVQGATGSIGIKDHRCTRNLSLYTVKKGAFEMLHSTEPKSSP
jgi:ABC-type branched-subunit amino acid transport system substrate-binding protein